MSELLVGFDMPTDMAVALAIDNGIVYAKTEQMKDWKRLDGVSVHHIPPHGDLIDRDALMKGEGRYIISFGKEGIDVAEINRAPTIIPAEDGES